MSLDHPLLVVNGRSALSVLAPRNEATFTVLNRDLNVETVHVRSMSIKTELLILRIKEAKNVTSDLAV